MSNTVSSFYSSGKVFIGLFIVTLILMQYKQHKTTNFDCEICSDKAGYYMYLPATFYYGFKAGAYPKSFDHEHGDGFYLDHTNDKVITKFTTGVALLQLPFYTLGYCIDKIIGINAHPYSTYYLFFINLGLACYLTIGLYTLYKWYAIFTNPQAAWWTSLLAFIGTNLFYYTIDESLMSHAYSFSMFAIMLYAVSKYYNTSKTTFFILFCIASAMAILIRPTNIIMVPFSLIIQPTTLSIKNSLIKLMSLKNIIYGITILSMVILPQCIYWKFAYNQWFVWSYQGEGFSYWRNPQFLTTLFSPQSGLFPYTPIMLLSILCLLFIRETPHKWAILLLLLVIIYMFSSWHNPYFGVCNFGKRPIVEYYPVLMIPILFLVSKIPVYKKWQKFGVIILIFVLVYYNLIFTLGFNTCFFGKPWEWEAFGLLLKKVFLFK